MPRGERKASDGNLTRHSSRLGRSGAAGSLRGGVSAAAGGAFVFQTAWLSLLQRRLQRSQQLRCQRGHEVRV